MSDETKAILAKPACSVAEFAKVMGLSKNGAYEAVQRGEVRSIRFGKKIVVPTAQIRQMLGMTEPAKQSA